MEWNFTYESCWQALVDVEVFSDASGSWGCGAYSGSQWFQLAWSSDAVTKQIAVKELITVVFYV